jgi:acetyltransferase-like isoleucine patch superfamily enzyme
MAAMRSFLRKDYNNLIIVDFICRGINSPKVWQKYLDSFEERYGSPVVYAKAKSKEYGWRNLTQKVILANGKSYYETKDECYYTIGYIRTNAYCRPSCYECRFKGFPRIADITLADYWGIENFNKSMEKDLGTSLVMVNSKKGEKYFENIKPRINYVQSSFESILKGNPALVKPLDLPKVNRKAFFEDLNIISFSEVSSKYFLEKNIKRKIKKLLRTGYIILRDTRLYLIPVLQLLKYNHYGKCVSAFWNGKGLVPSNHCVIEISKKANIILNGMFRLGIKRFKNSKLETRLLVEDGATLEIKNDLHIMYGSDIEVFKNAVLSFGGRGGSNINCTIICAERIVIGKDVIIGRNVTIRDNNGGHYLNRQGYKNTKPVIIEDKAWLCEGCIIMSGVHIGEGAIIGAHAFVTNNVPAHALVSGNPARIIDEDVLWKY